MYEVKSVVKSFDMEGLALITYSKFMYVVIIPLQNIALRTVDNVKLSTWFSS